MPNKNDETLRWGGPGSSHQNADQAPPDPMVKDPDDPDHLSPRSQISGGGGEGDIRHGHAPEAKARKQASSEEKRHEDDGRRLKSPG